MNALANRMSLTIVSVCNFERSKEPAFDMSQQSIDFAQTSKFNQLVSNAGVRHNTNKKKQCLRQVRDLRLSLGVLRSFDVDEHHEDVGEEHVGFALDLNLLSQVFSQAVHEALDCVIFVLFVMCIMLTTCIKVACFHAFNGE